MEKSSFAYNITICNDLCLMNVIRSPQDIFTEFLYLCCLRANCVCVVGGKVSQFVDLSHRHINHLLGHY